MRPLASVAGTRCTRCTPLSYFSLLYAPRPSMVATTSFRPPTPVSLDDISSSRHPCRSAYLLYMRNSSAAKRAASSPPVPARISRTMFRSSFGSFGISRIFRSASRASRRAVSDFSSCRASSCMSASPDLESSSVCARSRTTRLVFPETLHERLDLGRLLGVLPEFGRIALHLGRAQQLQQLVVPLLDRSQFIEHTQAHVEPQRTRARRGKFNSACSAVSALIVHPPDTGGRKATSSPSRST